MGELLEALKETTPEGAPRHIQKSPTGRPQRSHLMDQGIPESTLLQRASEKWGWDLLVSLPPLLPREKAVGLWPARWAARYAAVPLREDGETLHLALACPDNSEVVEELALLSKRLIRPYLISEKLLFSALRDIYGVGTGSAEQVAPPAPPLADFAHPAAETSSTPSVIHVVNDLLTEAVRLRATDIHLEPMAGRFRVRYRVDGILHDAKETARLKDLQPAVVSRIKIMSRLSITERRLPQDGRMEMSVNGAPLDMRVSVMPTPLGESLVIRLLTSRSLITLPQLGFFEEDLPRLRRFLSDPHGLLFLTGPTGSGKTTSLYAFLNEINTVDKKIVTLEDPIEYQMEGVTQIQIHPAIGLTFASGLRSLLRHDPDVMMVGEVRDPETAETAVRTALTGHLVFSTLHTNDAPSAITRLLDLGLDPYLISSSVNGVLAQRLVRTVCPECRHQEFLTPDLVREFGNSDSLKGSYFRGKGCDHCLGTGYRGRTVIYEVVSFTPALRDLVHDRAPHRDIRSLAVREGYVPLRQCGFKKILLGQTTPEEVLRATPMGGY